ncbi:NAD(P)H-dependent oxidoreductase [Paraflavitalea speifideaquila]|uniref:NADPH-dependent FMN reductase n=1 Tax=Paraflavitalea speifideaquila TaxID=3076558 RepID=UPI0028E46398|nr:NAD(P)H-dependent oxidoreductase [Paraflavitalea speifideiaquila]
MVICTPEYAFGVPGVLKNALDWLVSSGELNEKPVATISASPLYRGGDRAHASLVLTLQALGVKNSGQITIPAITTKLNEEGLLIHPETRQELMAFAETLVKAIDG